MVRSRNPPPWFQGGCVNEEIKAALIELAESAGGVLRPDDVIEAAKDKKSPLHGCFEWDKDAAAMEHWRDTARTLIRSVRVVIHNQTTTLRAPYFVRDPEADSKDQGYVALTSVRSDSEKARELLVDEFARAASSLRRAKEIAKALHMEDQVEGLIHGVLDLRQSITV